MQPPPGGLGGAPPPGGPVGYYAPPAGMSASRPAVILWYRVYCVVSALFGGGFIFLWTLMTPTNATNTHMGAEVLVYLAIGLPFLIFYGVGALAPYKPWGWTYGLIAIAFGMLSCLAPFSIILVIFWSRPQVKAAFQRV